MDAHGYYDGAPAGGEGWGRMYIDRGCATVEDRACVNESKHRELACMCITCEADRCILSGDANHWGTCMRSCMHHSHCIFFVLPVTDLVVDAGSQSQRCMLTACVEHL